MTAEHAPHIANVAEDVGPGPLSRLCDKEWQDLLDKSDRTSPAEYPDMALITRNELGAVISEGYLLAKSPAPTPATDEVQRLTDLLAVEDEHEKLRDERDDACRKLADALLNNEKLSANSLALFKRAESAEAALAAMTKERDEARREADRQQEIRIEKSDELDAMEDRVESGHAFKCSARAGGDDPTGVRADCDWPICGCDAYADKVIAALQESDLLKPYTRPVP